MGPLEWSGTIDRPNDKPGPQYTPYDPSIF
jgi:hypothetical protein